MNEQNRHGSCHHHEKQRINNPGVKKMMKEKYRFYENTVYLRK
jgi:hypothetical protein